METSLLSPWGERRPRLYRVKRLKREHLDSEVLFGTPKTFSCLIAQASPEELQALISRLVKSVEVSPRAVQLTLIERLEVALKEERERKCSSPGADLRSLILTRAY